MKIQLSEHFTYKRLLRFTLPSIAMMVFTSIYGVVDGFFVSNYVGNLPFAALNLIMPFLMVFSAVGLMLGTGGSALVAMTLGQGDHKKANELFSLMIYLVLILGLVFSIAGFAAAEPVARLLGATDDMIDYCVLYARVNVLGLMPFMLQNAFQSFLITAEKPKLGLYVTIAAGVTNMVLDWLFMGVFGMGLGSAAAATVIGELVGGGIPLIYFLRPNQSLLRLGKTRLYGRYIWKAVSNGLSEFMSNISLSVVNMVYNLQLMKYAGADGVSAYGIIMYTTFIFVGIFFGYSLGVSPIVGYHYGAQNREELHNVFKKSILLIGAVALVLTILAEALAWPMAYIFASYDDGLLSMTTTAIRIYSIAYLLMGFSIFGSAFFTALNNGMISALISLLRVLVFQIAAVLLLPLLFGLNGIWMAVIVAELLALFITAGCMKHYRKQYGY